MSAVASLHIEAGTCLSARINDSIGKDPASPNKEICFAASDHHVISGDTVSHSNSIRLPQTGKRINPSTKTASRIIKAGRIIDTKNYNTFLSARFFKTDGALSFQRFIYSICCLRL